VFDGTLDFIGSPMGIYLGIPRGERLTLCNHFAKGQSDFKRDFEKYREIVE
jgi:hypothetical protein